MATRSDCIAVIKEATGLTESEAKEALKAAEAAQKKLQAEGKLNSAEAMISWANQAGDDARIKAALQRKEVALNIMARDRLVPRIERFKADTKGNVREALNSILTGSHKKAFGARDSVGRNQAAILAQWLGGMVRELQEMPGVVDLLRKDKRFMDLVVHEMYQIKEGGKPGITNDPMARQAANIFSRYAEGARIRANEAGANIRKLGGWVPQLHDEAKMLKAGKEEWVSFTMRHLDLERTFPNLSLDEARDVLGDVFETIATGRDKSVMAAQKGEFLGPRNAARALEQHRVLHFMDSSSWLIYQDRFGKGNLMVNMASHLDRMSRKVAMMEMLGTNPENMFRSLLESERQKIRLDPDLDPKRKTKLLDSIKGDLGKREGLLGKNFAAVNGEIGIPHHVKAAKISAGVRAVQSLSKLGGALLSQFGDLLAYASNARYNGMSLFGAYSDAFRNFVSGRPRGEALQVSQSLGTMIDGMIGHMVDRWNAQDSLTGKVAAATDFFYKWSGMNYWQEVHQAGYARMLSEHMAEWSSKTWDQLDKGFRSVLEYHSFGERHWELMRQMVNLEADGRRYVLPENVRRLSEDAIDLFNADRINELRSIKGIKAEDLQARIDRLRSETRKRFETDLMAYFSDETRHAIIEPDARTRAAITQGTHPGTVLGEVVRFVTQFKSFPIAYYQTFLRAGRFKRPGTVDPAGIAHFIAASVVLGYASMTAKDFFKGKTPRDPSKWETWMAAAAQSGGAGIYGDFLFGKFDRFGGSPISAAAGPFAGSLSTAIQMGSEALRGEWKSVAGDAFQLAMNNTPFINMFYTRAALDWMVLYHLREMLSPGTLQRTEKRMKEEFNQQYILPPSRHIKTGGGWR